MSGGQLSLKLSLECRTPTIPGPELGQVFTREWIVNLILDLAGYTPDRDLTAGVAVEPSCGDGAFLGPMIHRLLESGRRHGAQPGVLQDALRALDLAPEKAEVARELVVAYLTAAGYRPARAAALASTWVVSNDFLLADDLPDADFVLGNPPYVRLEGVPAPLMSAYRRACPTMAGRSDLYVGFIERGLGLLRNDGVLGYIVADRWMHNQYGRRLRELVTRDFSVDAIVEMHDVDAFEDPVSAYPAITVIRRKPKTQTVLASANVSFGPSRGQVFSTWAAKGRSTTFSQVGIRAARMEAWREGPSPWPTGDPPSLALLEDLERRFPTLQDSQTRVGIGVATGADEVFITTDPTCAEEDRLLPLVTAPAIAGGRLDWDDTWLVNPWADDGGLVDLKRHPRLAKYFGRHADRLRRRHVAGRQPQAWYRTIDRVSPNLLGRPKLLLPDIKATSHPVLDEGAFYPHHNLYYVVSDAWNLEVLGGLLLSELTNLFVGAYCVKMRGGTYRFQAQYLRRIRVPSPGQITSADARSLAQAFAARDTAKATGVATRVYCIEPLPEWNLD